MNSKKSKGLFDRLRTRNTPAMREVGLVLKILRGSTLAMVGLGIVLVFVILALFAPWIAPYDPYEFEIENYLQPPSSKHLFGTDTVGRDVLSRIIFGSRLALLVGLIIITIGTLFGGVVGLTAGYSGKWAGEILMRITDIFLAFPALVLAITISAVLGPDLINALLAVSISIWPNYGRLFYAQASSVRENDYVVSAKIMGSSRIRIIMQHILPNVISPIIVRATMDMGSTILTVASLSFLGLGAQPPTADWGTMVNAGRVYIRTAWWLPTFPGLAILVLVLGLNLFGDGLRDALDPQIRRTEKVKESVSSEG